MVSKWSIYNDKIKEILSDNTNLSDVDVARKVLDTKESVKKNKDVDTLRTYIRRNKKSLLDLHEGVYSTTDDVDVPNDSVKHLWLKTKTASVFVKNPNYIDPEKNPEKEIDFLSIFKENIKPFSIDNKEYKESDANYIFDRAVFTDVHIGMDPNKDGYSLYGGKWDEFELNKRVQIFANHILENQKSDTLLLHELGDYMDGWDGLTTRGGHQLPQNMDNQKAFDVGLQLKIRLIETLITRYKKIKITNVCNDNHAGAFGYVVNSAFKAYIELKYPNNVTVTNQRKFIDHYFEENYCFILTHGKDDKSLKFGFKPDLDSTQVEKIKNYIDENRIYNHKIEFGKGDSHQYKFDNSTSKYFKYQNFPAFSPPSNWVQTNFQNSISGFVFFNYLSNRHIVHDYFFE